LAIVFNVRKDRRGTFASMFSLSNTIFIGLPVNLMLFGDSSLSYALLYYIANTILFWTIGVYGIARDAAIIAASGPRSRLNRGLAENPVAPSSGSAGSHAAHHASGTVTACRA